LGENMKGTGLFVTGALGLAVLALSTGSGQTQTQTNSQTNSQTQGQAQSSNSVSNASTSSGSVAASTNDALNAGSQNITFNNPAAPSTTTIKNVPSVYAPGLAAAGSEVCLGSISAGGAGAGFGLTIGGTIVDRECQLRLNARTLAVLGYPAAARETMCIDPNVRQAMLAAGTPCAADRVVYAPERVGYAPSAAPQRVVADPRNSRAAVEPVQNQPPQTVAASDPTSSATPDLQPGCHREYQLFGGWYAVCDNAEVAAPQRTADADPAPDQPPVQQGVRRKSTTGAKSAQADQHKPTQADQHKALAAAKPMQAAQQKSVADAKPTVAAPWKTMDPMQADQPMAAAKPVQADQPKPLAAAKPVQADQPKPMAAAKPVQADQPKPLAAAKPVQADQFRDRFTVVKPMQADQPKPLAAAKPMQADQSKTIAAAKPVQADQPKPLAAAKPVQADQPKPIAAAKPVQADGKAIAANQADQRKSTAAAKPEQTDQGKSEQMATRSINN
jgi:hypothetical protein